ncbi:PEP/pyruvate-binding domain-containing protein [Streptomyces sp. NPDC001978]|uniref:PEP/pyruvate-binding domain-containing protein n=1 Tax=Streptomyces sp. NPDC001978 TaxID=3364627 RepID=UPI00368DD5B6
MPTTEIGGKATGLGDLVSRGYPVPDGFVVPTSAYTRVIAESGLQGRISQIMEETDGEAASGRASQALRALFDDLVLPSDIADAIARAYGDLVAGESEYVAVRSSATAEDLAEASFAGQQETYLWIAGAENVQRHVVQCWASLFTPQAIGYRARLGMGVDDLAMGVVVQRMVPARSAGVLMTLDPLNGDRSTIYIESAFGLGEGVVRGDVAVDRFWVDKASASVRSSIAEKLNAHQFDRETQSVRLVAVDPDSATRPSISEQEAVSLAGLAKRVEADQERPMDIEWAVDDEGTLFLLQARAETVWSQRTGNATGSTAGESEPSATNPLTLDDDWDPLHSTGAPDLHWSTDNIGEANPGVMTPLGFAWCVEATEASARAAGYRMGVLSRKERRRAPDDRILVRPFFGRTAMQAEFFALMGDRTPGASGVDTVRGILGRVPDDFTFAPTRRRYPIIAIRLPLMRMVVLRQARKLAATTDAWWKESVRKVPGLGLRECLELHQDAYRRYMENHCAQGATHFAVVSPLFQQLGQLIKKAGTGDISALSGGGGAELAIISDVWRASRGQMTVEEVVAVHGSHGPAEGEISSPVWREDAEPLRRLVSGYAERPDDESPIERMAAAEVRLPQARAAVLSALPGWRRPMAARLLARAARGIPMRGVSKRGFVQCMDVGRATARRAGALLAEAGTLADPDDIFYLTVEELGRPLPDDVQSLVDRRRARRAYYQTLEIPAMWKGSPTPRLANSMNYDDMDHVEGIGVSPGVVEGVARVVHDPTFVEVQSDEILIAPTTDPSWSAILLISRALVVDIGGALSHAAVVARELGVPCVVGTRNGTEAIRTGDRVRVDGDSGTVTILKRAE